jgi:hypothetical protein
MWERGHGRCEAMRRELDKYRTSHQAVEREWSPRLEHVAMPTCSGLASPTVPRAQPTLALVRVALHGTSPEGGETQGPRPSRRRRPSPYRCPDPPRRARPLPSAATLDCWTATRSFPIRPPAAQTAARGIGHSSPNFRRLHLHISQGQEETMWTDTHTSGYCYSTAWPLAG